MRTSIVRTLQISLVLAAMAVSAAAAAQSDNTAAVDTAKLATTQKAPYGAYLVDSAGWSVYLFKADANAEGSTCYGKCAKKWPAVLTDGKPELEGKASGKLNEELLGTIKRKNGATQVTYNGWPLYYFAQDDEPGDTNGQDMKGFGAEWYLLTPQGTVLEVEEHGSEGSGS